jgi:hypothetical protein
LFAAVSGTYLLANLVASTMACRKEARRYFPVLPLVFAVIHVAWGAGFWYGLANLLFDRGDSQSDV